MKPTMIKIKITYIGKLATTNLAKCKNVMELECRALDLPKVCTNIYTMYKYMIPGDYDCLVGSFIMNNVDAFGLDTKYKTVYETYYLKIEAKKI